MRDRLYYFLALAIGMGTTILSFVVFVWQPTCDISGPGVQALCEFIPRMTAICLLIVGSGLTLGGYVGLTDPPKKRGETIDMREKQCPICGKWFKSLGYARHRAMHYDRKNILSQTGKIRKKM